MPNKTKTRRNPYKPRTPKVSQFLSKVHRMASDQANARSIKWSEDGNQLVIANRVLLVNECVGKYEMSTNFSSFVRQLNFYGFTKVSSLRKERQVIYEHPLFSRGNFKQLKLIQRVHRPRGLALLNPDAQSEDGTHP